MPEKEGVKVEGKTAPRMKGFCLPLVYTEHEEGDYIYHNEVEDKRFAQKREKFHVT